MTSELDFVRPVPGARGVGVAFILAAIAGLVASAVLTYDKVQLAADSGYKLGCDINAVVACGAVISSWQAELFGFPNPFIGLAAFPVLGLIGIALLAGIAPPRWFRAGVLAACSLALIFVGWLISQSLYVIGALCPWCMLAWAATIVALCYSIFYYLAAQDDRDSNGLRPNGLRNVVLGLHWLWPLTLAAVVLTLVFARFGGAVFGG